MTGESDLRQCDPTEGPLQVALQHKTGQSDHADPGTTLKTPRMGIRADVWSNE